MWVIGTAGHVDHGKSSLVTALTGMHPDRLKEEQEREMTIELGFAWFTLPGGQPVGVVDVPGHRDFIDNMLAGVGGIDAALFVVAADEGVMPQTREHLAILDILQVKQGVIALTKVDLVDDPDWLDLVEADILDQVAGTVLEGAPVVRVSARTGAGIEDLRHALADCLTSQPTRPDLGRPRLPIDRVFTIAGFGTVVTGTLSDGQLKVGDEVEILPGNRRARIRGLQSHKKKVDHIQPGNRVAVNLTGVDVSEITRGQVLTRVGHYQATNRLDVAFRLLLAASQPVRHNQEVKLFLGASEVLARVRVLGAEQIAPGKEGWLQLELTEPVVAVRGDRYILRRPSPGETLGGGVVVDPAPARRHRRFASEVIERLQSLSQGAPSDLLLQAAATSGVAALKHMVERAHLDGDQAAAAVEELVQAGLLVLLEDVSLPAALNGLAVSRSVYSALQQKALDEVTGYHRQYPLRRGMPKEALKSRLKLAGREFQSLLKRWVEEGALAEHGSALSLPGFTPALSPAERAAVDRLLDQFRQSPYSPPPLKECQAQVGDEVTAYLLDQGILLQVSPEVVFRREDFDAMLAFVREHLQAHETLTVAEFRDRFQTSRRYALGFLEYLDQTGVTVRVEDARRLANRPANH